MIQSLPEQIVADMMASDAFSQWLDLKVREVQDGYCRLTMEVRSDMVNGFGVCHGGVTFAMADSAFAFASNTQGKVSVSIDNAIHYPAAVRVGDTLTATARQISSSNKLGHYEVNVTNQDDTQVALFRGTVYRTHKVHKAAQTANEG